MSVVSRPAPRTAEQSAEDPTSGAPEIDVVILTWNDGPLLDAAIASVRASRGVRCRIIVVDNGSTEDVVVGDDVVLLRNEHNRGVAAGRNQGVAFGSAADVLILDSDAELRPDSLRALHDAMVEHDAALVVPVFEDQAPTDSAGRAPGLVRKALRVAGRTAAYAPSCDPTGPVWPVDFGIGACQLFRRAAWEAVGGIDESFFYGPEDVDFCLRILDAGHDVLQVGDAPVLHPPRRIHRKPIDRAGRRHLGAVLRYAIRHRRRLLLRRSGR